jgi:tRNA uridine 5-carboxymethylaminomethyl modification enzyme
MYSVIVVGGGHAGLEAITLASKVCKNFGGRVALITLKKDNIGMMSCNPAIGGIGKGVIVKEIDALGGIMAKAIDKASIHSKMLNQSKGEAVWGPRAQADRELYKKASLELVEELDNLDIIYEAVESLITEGGKAVGVKLANGNIIEAKAIVLTTGTFLSGMILRGLTKVKGGRINEEPSYGLSSSLRELGLEVGRLKTGTPPRLVKSTINFDILEKQEGDNPPVPFSYLTKEITNPQVFCGITHTNAKGHDLMMQNADKSPIYTKQISAKGPRYCPSIEDKIIRFSEKEEHRIFLEPEGLNNSLVYPNGISTSMPEEVQLAFLRTIKGLEEVEVATFGYAIEYDFVNPEELKATLETKKCKGLFFAGQINGTTGYEEAGGQGVVAGINAGLYAFNGEANFIIDRSEGYIGVMIDDLITKGVIEPYRMFTSRSEYRLLLRADNADLRLTQKIIDLNICEPARMELFLAKTKGIDEYMELLKSKTFTSTELNRAGISVSQDGIKRNGFEAMCHQLVSFEDVNNLFDGKLAEMPQPVKEQIQILAKYDFYLKQQQNDVRLFKKDEGLKIPENFDFTKIKSLSSEVIEKFNLHRPQNVGQALRIQGITPASIIALTIALRS